MDPAIIIRVPRPYVALDSTAGQLCMVQVITMLSQPTFFVSPKLTDADINGIVAGKYGVQGDGKPHKWYRNLQTV